MSTAGLYADDFFQSQTSAENTFRRVILKIGSGFGMPETTVRLQLAADEQIETLAQTTSGPRPVEAPGDAIGEIRRLSGLTWDQLARVFDVSRRALHFWASGKPMSAEHQERLNRVLYVISRIARDDPQATRAALLMPLLDDGETALDLLAQHQFDAVIELLGRYGRREWPQQPPTEDRLYNPLPPATLLGALEDPVRLKAGRGRAVKMRRINKSR